MDITDLTDRLTKVAQTPMSRWEYVQTREFKQYQEHTLYLKMRDKQKAYLYTIGFHWGFEDGIFLLSSSKDHWPYKWKEYPR